MKYRRLHWFAYLLAGCPILFGNFAAAQEQDEETIEDVRQQQHKRAQFLLVSRAMSQGRYADAIDKYTEIIEEFPEEKYRILAFRGEAHFMNGDMSAAIADFDAIIEANESVKPRLWQRGLALYYAQEYEKGREQFESHQKANPQDVENAVWHYLCVSQRHDIETAREQLIPIDADPRVPMQQIHDLFAGNGTEETVFRAAADVTDPGESGKANYYANLYVGLYYHAAGDAEKSNKFIRAAAEASPYPPHVLMGQVARVHLEATQSDE